MARLSSANSSILALASGYGWLGIGAKDSLSDWANGHTTRIARRLISPFTWSWEAIYPLGKKIRKSYELRVLSDEEAKKIGELRYMLIDGEEAAVSIPALDGGFFTEDQQLVEYLNANFRVMWSSSVEFHRFVTANRVLFDSPPEEVLEIDIGVDVYPEEESDDGSNFKEI